MLHFNCKSRKQAKNGGGMRRRIRESGLVFCLVLAVVVLCNVQPVKAQSNLTVEGVWEVMSATPLTTVSQGDLGQKLSIVQKGDTYELKWLSGSRAGNPSASYSGSMMQIAKIYNDPIWSGGWTAGEARGEEREPANLGQQVAGIIYPNTVSYTLSSDGLSLQRCEDAVRVHWRGGRYTHYETLPCYFKETFRRVSGPTKVENRGDRAYQADCGPVDPNRTTPITTDLCPGNLVAMTYFCGGGNWMPLCLLSERTPLS